MNRGVTITMLLAVLCVSCTITAEKEHKKIPVIFDTDMGNDIDDALALAMLQVYIDEGRVALKGVVSSKDNIYAARYIDIVNSWYGHPDVPIGMVRHGKTKEHPSYTKYVADLEIEGRKVFSGSVEDYTALPDAVSLYRKILSESEDHSVVIVTVGFSTNIARLLDSDAELIAKKVDYLCMMAGDFSGDPVAEYNVVTDTPAAMQVFEQWPTNIVISPFPVGLAVTYPASSIETDFRYVKFHPVAEAYKAYAQMPYDRPTWDLTALLYVVEADSGFFHRSKPGKVSVDPETGFTRFKPVESGHHTYLTVDREQAERIRQRFIQIVPTPPMNITQQ